ncbi:actin cytoskeleton-regulatory complex protein PAN1-like [Magnolia sinica]|uniref:actin cytoskeleton-regulatory complex protein PAN1-like n=1 Tax=Magnolia sinica TaxID=86752 RepID=UPI00265A652E|nr:actin cytoskeleton-regulatory complex protein PAN1-like [Magnolia sinica]
MNNAFNGQILAEKLSKLNNSQQSIETLSHWCISHRKKAKQVVETWDKLFNGSQREQRVPFLYLANDILQNSRRKGSEFVNEFWKVLPGALKDVFENGGDHGKNVVSRLVGIWEERKVFGSRGRSLKDEMLGKDPPPILENNGKSLQSHSIKVGKKDAHSIRIKLAIGGMPEKIVTAFQSVHDEHFKEDTALNKCKAAIRRVGKMEKDVDNACIQGNQQGSTLTNELQEHETILRECIDQLGSVEATRAALVAQLKEALQEQESKLELIRTQMQVAQAQIEQASNMQQRLTRPPGATPTTPNPPAEAAATAGPTPRTNQTTGTPQPPPPQPLTSIIQTTNTPYPPPPQPVTAFANAKTASEEDHKKAAAAVAAKLAASTSSAQMLSSIFSSLAAEEAAASKNTLNVSSFTTTPPIFPPEKRPKLEKPMSVSEMGNTYFGHMQQQQLSTLPLMPAQTPTTSMQPMTQTNQPQTPFPPPPPPLPPPPLPVQQYVQSNGVMAGTGPFGYGGSGLPPPPPPPNHMLMSLARPGTQQQPQQHSITTGYYQSPGMGFYGQSHQPSTPSVPRP